jgi:hypothetical protein
MPDFDKLAHRLLYELTGEQAYTKGEHDTLRDGLIAVYNEALRDAERALCSECKRETPVNEYGFHERGLYTTPCHAAPLRANKVAPLSATS